MKKIIFTLILCISFIGFSQDSLHWETDFDTAKKLAAQQKKPILMYFTGSDWCAPCKHLKIDFFNSEKFKSQANNMVLLMVDLPFREDIITPEQRKKNKILIKKYNPEESFPLLIALNKKGKELNRISAYSSLRDTTLHFKFLDKMLR